jgi:hypothetical protein
MCVCVCVCVSLLQLFGLRRDQGALGQIRGMLRSPRCRLRRAFASFGNRVERHRQYSTLATFGDRIEPARV